MSLQKTPGYNIVVRYGVGNRIGASLPVRHDVNAEVAASGKSPPASSQGFGSGPRMDRIEGFRLLLRYGLSGHSHTIHQKQTEPSGRKEISSRRCPPPPLSQALSIVSM